MSYPPARVKYSYDRGCCSSLSSQFAQLSRRPFLRVIAAVTVLVGIYALYCLYERAVDNWLPEGMMKYHMEMTPQFYKEGKIFYLRRSNQA